LIKFIRFSPMEVEDFEEGGRRKEEGIRGVGVLITY
jgi:hypothetical protein